MKIKNLFTLFACALGAATVNAQSIVSTTATNKNVVLEELTGKTCGWCPAGHLIGKQLSDANPGRIVLLNIHTGGYAAGTPNYRTAWGDYVGALYPVSGYPTGAVNRTDFGNGVMHSRGQWTANAGTVMGQSSPVNVGANASINLSTRAMTLDVEAYYTAAGAGSSNKFHAIITQNNIPGPQSGASNNPGAILPNGDYNHQHMVRHNLTPNAGDNIAAVSATSLYTNQYTYTFPNDINNIAINLIDMEVAVYVSESATTGAVVSGDHANITYVTPPGTSTASAAIAANATAGTGYCAYNYTPSVNVTNSSTSGAAIDSFLVSYSINGATPVTQLITTSLAANQSTAVSFPQVQLTSGANAVSYEIDFASYNSSLIDISSASNKAIEDGPYFKLNATSTPAPVSEGMENATLPSGSAYTRDITTGIFASTEDLNRFSVVDGTVLVVDNQGNTAGPIGGFATSNRSLLVSFFNVTASAAPMYFAMHKVNLGTPAQLTFDHAYCQYQNENDRLEVEVSTDCGATWTSVWNKAGSTLSTKAAQTAFFLPTNASDWTSNTIDLSAYNNTNDVVIRFKATSAYGNNLYIDNINLSNATNVTTIQEDAADVRIMPNPVSDQMTLEFTMLQDADASINIMNALGQEVQQVTTGSFSGTNTIEVNTSNLSAGVYFLNIRTNEGATTQRFIKE